MKLTPKEMSVVERLYYAAVAALDAGVPPKRLIRTTRDAIMEWRLREPSESVPTRSQHDQESPERTQTPEKDQ